CARGQANSQFRFHVFTFSLYPFFPLIRMNDSIRSLFPITQTRAYLNSAAVSPIPTIAIEAVNSQLLDVAASGSANYPRWVATKDRARTLAAEMLGVRADQIAFT